MFATTCRILNMIWTRLDHTRPEGSFINNPRSTFCSLNICLKEWFHWIFVYAAWKVTFVLKLWREEKTFAASNLSTFPHVHAYILRLLCNCNDEKTKNSYMRVIETLKLQRQLRYYVCFRNIYVTNLRV